VSKQHESPHADANHAHVITRLAPVDEGVWSSRSEPQKRPGRCVRNAAGGWFTASLARKSGDCARRHRPRQVGLAN